MTTHIMSLTYAPKIEAVKAGKINQTIRLKRSLVPKQVGDDLILHTWKEKPYRSKWDWRLKTKIVYMDELSYLSGRWWLNDGSECSCVEDEVMNAYARRDGIVPETKTALEATLMRLNGLTSLEYTLWDVIGWAVTDLKGVQ